MQLLSRILCELTNIKDYFKLTDVFHQNRHKRFTELVTFIHYSNSNLGNRSSSVLADLTDFVNIEIAKLKPDTIFRNQCFAFNLIMPYILTRKQKKNARLEKCLKILLDGNMNPIELLPYRELELAYFKAKLNKPHEPALRDSSILNANLNLPHLNRDLTYSLTHTLFYLTDFGFSNDRPMLRDPAKLKFQIECLIVKSYRNGDVDVILELAINYFSLKSCVDINPGILAIIQAALSRSNFIEFDWKQKGLIDQKYHSFLVLGILCNLIEHHLKKYSNTPYAEKLLKVYNTCLRNTESKSVDYSKVESMEAFRIWDLLISTAGKKIIPEKYIAFSKSGIVNKYLANEISRNLDFNARRNQKDILWDTEYKILGSSKNNRLKLKAAYNTAIGCLKTTLT